MGLSRVTAFEKEMQMVEGFWYNYKTAENFITYNVFSGKMTVWVYHNGNFDNEKGKKIWKI